jgi:hypothetical protein
MFLLENANYCSLSNKYLIKENSCFAVSVSMYGSELTPNVEETVSIDTLHSKSTSLFAR